MFKVTIAGAYTVFLKPAIYSVSSAGRAFRLHRKGQRFESVTEYQMWVWCLMVSMSVFQTEGAGSSPAIHSSQECRYNYHIFGMRQVSGSPDTYIKNGGMFESGNNFPGVHSS